VYVCVCVCVCVCVYLEVSECVEIRKQIGPILIECVWSGDDRLPHATECVCQSAGSSVIICVCVYVCVRVCVCV